MITYKISVVYNLYTTEIKTLTHLYQSRSSYIGARGRT